MKNTELLLTNVPMIFELKDAGLTYKEIARVLCEEYRININENTVRNFLHYLKIDKFHKKYTNFVLFDVDGEYSTEFLQKTIVAHNLIITNIFIARYYKLDHLILTAKNYKQQITTEEGALYAKRLLKQYKTSDKELILSLRQKYPTIERVNYQNIIDELHCKLEGEVCNWIQKLKIYQIELIKEKGKM